MKDVPHEGDTARPEWMAELEAAGWRMPRKPGAGRSAAGQPRIDPNKTYPEPDHPYVRAGFKLRLADLAAMGKDSGRNSALNEAAVYLGGFPVDRDQIRNQLLAACQTNGVLAEDGRYQCDATISSGFAEADRREPHPIKEQPTNVTYIHHDPVTPAADVTLPDIEQHFWERPTLKHIYDAALDGMCSPWAVFACTATRTLAKVPPEIALPPTVGAAGGSLNFCAAISSESGGGKSTADTIAIALTEGGPGGDYLVLHPGSGEGLIDAYRCEADPEHPDGRITSVMFLVDEVETLTALGGRTGSTLMSVIRTAFSGGGLGNQNVSAQLRGKRVTKEPIPAGSYRFTIIVSVQPIRAAGLLGDLVGTAQRFMWFPALDPRVKASKNRPGGRRKGPRPPIRPLPTPPPYPYRPGETLTNPEAADDLIEQNREDQNDKKVDALDGHAVFARLKLAYAITLIDGRNEMTDDDWQLSGIAAAVSDWTRAGLAAASDKEERRKSREKGKLRGVEQHAAEDEKQQQIVDLAGRIQTRVLTKIVDSTTPLTSSQIGQALNSRDRKHAAAALTALAGAGRIQQDPDSQHWTLAK